MSPDRARALRQLALSYIALNALIFGLSRALARRYGLDQLIGALFLFGGLASIRADDDNTARYGVSLGGLFPGQSGDERSLVRAVWESIPSALRELAIAAAIAAVVFPVIAFFWPMFNPVRHARRFVLDGAHLRDIANNLLAVALTEEIYFRGYVQTRVADVLGVGAARTWKNMALPVLLTSLLFALTHLVVEVTPERAAVFFPALLFGALRVVRGGIGAAVFFHAASNVFSAYLDGR